MVFSIVGLSGMVFSIVGLPSMVSVAWLMLGQLFRAKPGPFWAMLGSFLTMLKSFWCHSGQAWAIVAILSHAGTIQGRAWAILKPLWARLGPFCHSGPKRTLRQA